MRRIAVWLCLGLLLGASSLAAAAAETQRFRRGIGIADAMGWAQPETPGGPRYAASPFSDAARRLQPDALSALRRNGFDFVRLAVDPGPFLQFKGRERDELDALLLREIKAFLSAGLSVIVDFHPADGVAAYAPAAFTDAGSDAFVSYVAMLGRTAALLRSLPADRIALEIMNEPVAAAAEWQRMLEAAYRAIRRAAPTLPLVLGGAREGMPEGLLALRTGAFRDDANVFYTFHFYEPYQFTHQGAGWNPARHLADVPYPARARPVAEAMAATEALIATASLDDAQRRRARADGRRRLADYWRSGFDRAAIARVFDGVLKWSRDNAVPPERILLGEFGTRPARAGERAQWLRDVREEAEARRFPWAVWVYRDSGGFALADPQTRRLQPALLRALGLTATQD